MDSPLTFANGFSLDLAYSGDSFLGIGAVKFGHTLLRSGELPWIFYTESESVEFGVSFEDFVLEEIIQSADEITLKLKSRGRSMPRLQAADSMGESRIRARRTRAVEARFDWKIRAITETIEETTWQGLAMSIRYHCDAAPIHWLMETATWEIGGEATGACLIQQNVSAIQLEQPVRAGDAFSTIEKFVTKDSDDWYPMDMMPRMAGSCICDFQSKKNTALCLFSEKPGHTRARLEKFTDENVIHHLDRMYFPLGTDVVTPERKLLVCESSTPLHRHEARNLWLDCFTEVRRRILANYGFQLELPEPASGGHLWDWDLKERMTHWADPYERDFPEYARLGYRQLFVHGVWDGITSDPDPPEDGNICCSYSFHYAEEFGGSQLMKRLVDRARANGLRLMQWYPFHFSRHSKIWEEHPEWVLREAGGDPWDAGYEKLWSGRMRSGFAEEFRSQIENTKKETGIDGIFWESYHNFGLLGIDWSGPDKAPQADEIFQMQAKLQREGFRQWSETATIFGVSRVALFGFNENQFCRRLWQDFVDGDQAFALLDVSPQFFLEEGEELLTPERLSPERYFWMAAHRVLPGLASDPWEIAGSRLPGGKNAEAYARVNHLYNALVPHMSRLRLQPEGSHVVWNDKQGRPSVIWAFQEAEFSGFDDMIDIESGEQLSGRMRPGRAYGLGTHIDWAALLSTQRSGRTDVI